MKPIISFVGKMKGAGQSPGRPPIGDVLWSWIGASSGMGAISMLAVMSKLPLLIAPFGATCVLIFAASDSPLAQPRAVIGGYLMSTFVGVLALLLLGTAPWVVAVAVGTAIAMMQLTRTLHAPAGAVPLLTLSAGTDSLLLIPSVLVGSCTLIGIGLVINNLRSDRSYPRYWV